MIIILQMLVYYKKHQNSQINKERENNILMKLLLKTINLDQFIMDLSIHKYKYFNSIFMSKI
jgi:hypothetical protein